MADKNLYIIGASGHGKVIADIATLIGVYRNIYFLDDNLEVKKCGKYDVVGTTKDLQYIGDNSDIFVAIGNSKIRKRIMENVISNSLNLVALIHPNAIIASDVEIGKGSVIMAGGVINSGAKIGQGVIINTSSSVDHDCVIGNYAHIAVGAHVAGAVTIGDLVWVGAGAAVINNLVICDECMIGAGAVVVSDLIENGTYVGVPARRLR